MSNGFALYRASAFFLRLYFNCYHGVIEKGREQIPQAEPLIFACNHASNIDPPLIGAYCPKRLSFLAKDSLFKNPIFSKLITELGAIPVSREDSQKAGTVIKTLLSLLKRGHNILVFPEGTRSSDGELQPLEAGVAFLALRSNVPILPVYVGGTFEACPKGKRPKPLPLFINWGSIIDTNAILHEFGEKAARKEILVQLDSSLKTLCEEYRVHRGIS